MAKSNQAALAYLEARARTCGVATACRFRGPWVAGFVPSHRARFWWDRTLDWNVEVTELLLLQVNP